MTTNLKRKLEATRNSAVKIARQKDAAFNPYEVLNYVATGEGDLAGAIQPSRHLAKLQVDIADLIFRHIAADDQIPSILAGITQELQGGLPPSQKLNRTEFVGDL